MEAAYDKIIFDTNTFNKPGDKELDEAKHEQGKH